MTTYKVTLHHWLHTTPMGAHDTAGYTRNLLGAHGTTGCIRHNWIHMTPIVAHNTTDVLDTTDARGNYL